MAKIIKFKCQTIAYAECSCGCDLFLLHLDPEKEDPPEVIALECSGCRTVIPFEEESVIELELF